MILIKLKIKGPRENGRDILQRVHSFFKTYAKLIDTLGIWNILKQSREFPQQRVLKFSRILLEQRLSAARENTV